jgi:catalase
LAQIYNIAPEYSQGVYDLLEEKEFDFDEVPKLAETAHEWYKQKKFRPSQGEKLTGYAPRGSVYSAEE